MNKNLVQLLMFSLLLTIFLTGCGDDGDSVVGGNMVILNLVYGSEKQAWLEPLV